MHYIAELQVNARNDLKGYVTDKAHFQVTTNENIAAAIIEKYAALCGFPSGLVNQVHQTPM